MFIPLLLFVEKSILNYLSKTKTKQPILSHKFLYLFNRNPSIICGTTTTEHSIAPVFDQFHIVLATIRLPRSNDTASAVTPDRVSVILLSQKHVYNGVVFKLFELYGIENHPSKFSTNNIEHRRKSLIKVLTTSSLNENEPFLNRYEIIFS